MEVWLIGQRGQKIDLIQEGHYFTTKLCSRTRKLTSYLIVAQGQPCDVVAVDCLRKKQTN